MTRRGLLIALAIVLLVPLALLATDQAICAVCGPREGSGFEPVRATAILEGKHYSFCSNRCKVEFLKNPQEFLIGDIGAAAPGFTLARYEGGKLSLAELKGKVVLLDFWATYCPPCIQALPQLEALHRKHAARGLAVVGLSVDEREALVRKALSQAGVTYPNVRSEASVWNAYKVNALPALVLVGRDGTIRGRFGGEADPARLHAAIEAALAE